MEPAAENQPPVTSPEIPDSSAPAASEPEPTVSTPEPPKKKERFSPALLRAAQRRLDTELSVAPLDGVVKVSRDVAIKAAKTLGLSGKQWGVRAMRAKEELGEYLTQPLVVCQIIAVSTANTLSQLEGAIEAGAKLVKGENLDPEKKIEIPIADRAKALQALALASEAHVQLSAHLLKISESANPKETTDAPPPNLPPSFGLEVTSADGAVTRVVANSGG